MLLVTVGLGERQGSSNEIFLVRLSYDISYKSTFFEYIKLQQFVEEISCQLYFVHMYNVVLSILYETCTLVGVVTHSGVCWDCTAGIVADVLIKLFSGKGNNTLMQKPIDILVSARKLLIISCKMFQYSCVSFLLHFCEFVFLHFIRKCYQTFKALQYETFQRKTEQFTVKAYLSKISCKVIAI